MRKHSARKWLHFILDLLPVIILPVFAIYEINHDTNQPIEITTTKSLRVDFNQISTPLNDGTYDGVSYDFEGSVIHLSGTISTRPNYGQYALSTNYTFKRDGSKYYVRFSGNETYRIGIGGYSYYSQSYIFSDNASTSWNSFAFLYVQSVGETINLDNLTLNIFDLTQMFGRGNEPTKEEFDLLYPNQYYAPVSSDIQLIDDYEEVTYSDTDIGSQMMYALYKPVKNYFNFNNVFNFGDIYHWFELNIFHGTAPMSFFIVWNIVLYQFVMDLVFLIYGLFMWFIDMCEKLMDKPLNSIK